MNDVLNEYIDVFVVVYLDDVVLYSRSLEEHILHLKLVLSRFREYKLYIKKEKCELRMQKITFLGHIIS